MGDIPDWLAQLAADSEQAPDELKRDVDASASRDAMPDMSGALEDILAFDETAFDEDPTTVFSARNAEPDPLAFMADNKDDDSRDSLLFAPDAMFFDDGEEEQRAVEETARETKMMANLRHQANSALPADLAQSEPGAMDRLNTIFASTGMKSWQLAVLAVMAFLDIAVVGLILLFVLGFFVL